MLKKTIIVSFCCLLNSMYASELKVYDDEQFDLLQQTSDPEKIANLLNPIGIRFEQWIATQDISKSSSEDEIKQAYKDDIERLQRENGFQSVDVLRMVPNHPKKLELRQKYLNEHTHDEDEVRFFVQGSGHFFLHVEGKVYSVLCEQGDLISIPPFYRHWFDMGTDPDFTAIRFFTRMDGWIAHFTNDPISLHFIDRE